MNAESLKASVRNTRVYDLLRRYRQDAEVGRWLRDGRQGPAPHLFKQDAIKRYAERFGVSVMIETGTYLGEMVYAMKDVFKRVVSIELDPELARRAVRRFAHYPHVSILQGDSGEVLASVLRELDEPALFWLDGHYSGGVTAKAAIDTPVVAELQHLFAHRVRDHVVLIDDARCFVGTDGYPTLDELRAMVRASRPEWEVELADDIIRAFPSGRKDAR